MELGKSQLGVYDSNYATHFTVRQTPREPETTGNEREGKI